MGVPGTGHGHRGESSLGQRGALRGRGKGLGPRQPAGAPRISEELAAFDEGLLAPLISYDRERGTRLTETFCLSLVLDSSSEVARRLYVHENTVRYRVRRAEQLLGCDLGSSKERITLGLAAFVWLRRG